MTDDQQTHWETVYATKAVEEVSWFEEAPSLSIDLIGQLTHGRGSVIDIGGGASRLAGVLVDRGYEHVAVLDLSSRALAIARERLNAVGDGVEWIVADVTAWQPQRRYDVWHDRAAFHFLNEPGQQFAYAAALCAALKVGGVAIIATFAPDGPEQCSGLAITRHDASSIATIIGPTFSLLSEQGFVHQTPGGLSQHFQFSTFRKME